MEPAALLPGLREHLAQRTPEPERAIPDREDRGAHPTPGAVTHQVRPGLDRLPVAGGQRNELLAAIGSDTDHDQQAQFVLFEADVDVVGVDPGRGAGVSTGPFPRAALRTGRAPRRRIRLSTNPV